MSVNVEWWVYSKWVGFSNCSFMMISGVFYYKIPLITSLCVTRFQMRKFGTLKCAETLKNKNFGAGDAGNFWRSGSYPKWLRTLFNDDVSGGINNATDWIFPNTPVLNTLGCMFSVLLSRTNKMFHHGCTNSFITQRNHFVRTQIQGCMTIYSAIYAHFSSKIIEISPKTAENTRIYPYFGPNAIYAHRYICPYIPV